MKIPTLGKLDILADFKGVIARFPVPSALMGLFTLILASQIDGLWRAEQIGRFMLGCILAAYLCVSFTLAREGQSKSKALVWQIVGSAVVLALAWFSKELRLNLFLTVGAAILILGNAPRWRRERNDLHVWDFTHKLWTGAVFAGVGCGIYTLGVLAIMAALKSLFGLDIDEVVEHVLLPLGLGFLAPLYWMSTLPPVDEDYDELYDKPGFVSKAVAFMGTWLLAPLTLIYAVILLAYGVKILLAGALPKGEIAALTTPFLLIGTFTWLVLEPPFVMKRALARLFRRCWFILSLPAALLLAVAIGSRIGQYGLTPERVMLALIVIWALGLALWFTFVKAERRDIRLIPTTAALGMCVAALTMEWASHVNQIGRLKDGLQESGIAAALEMEADITVTNEEAALKAKGALTYLYQNDGKQTVKHILQSYGYTGDLDDTVYELYKRLALDTINDPRSQESGWYASVNREGNVVDVAGFETLYGSFYLYSSQDGKDHAKTLLDKEGLKISWDGDLITFSRDGSELAAFNVTEWIGTLAVSENTIVLPSDYVHVLSTKDQAITVLIEHLSISDYSPTRKDQGSYSAHIYVLERGL